MDNEGQLAVFTSINLFVTQISNHALLPTSTNIKGRRTVFHCMLTPAEVSDLWTIHGPLCQPECDMTWSDNLEIKTDVFWDTQVQYGM